MYGSVNYVMVSVWFSEDAFVCLDVVVSIVFYFIAAYIICWCL